MSLNNQLATLVYMSEYTSGLKITFSYYHDVFPHILSYVKLINSNPISSWVWFCSTQEGSNVVIIQYISWYICVYISTWINALNAWNEWSIDHSIVIKRAAYSISLDFKSSKSKTVPENSEKRFFSSSFEDKITNSFLPSYQKILSITDSNLQS